jgi:hypothetical protein
MLQQLLLVTGTWGEDRARWLSSQPQTDPTPSILRSGDREDWKERDLQIKVRDKFRHLEILCNIQSSTHILAIPSQNESYSRAVPAGTGKTLLPKAFFDGV